MSDSPKLHLQLGLGLKSSTRKDWWTRSQRIRTFAEIPIEAAILDTAPAPVYQQIAPKALQLQQLGMSNSAIARRLDVTDKTVARAVAWLLEAQRPRSD